MYGGESSWWGVVRICFMSCWCSVQPWILQGQQGISTCMYMYVYMYQKEQIQLSSKWSWIICGHTKIIRYVYGYTYHGFESLNKGTFSVWNMSCTDYWAQLKANLIHYMQETSSHQWLTIDLFTNVSQSYGCFFPRDLITSHFVNMYLTMVFQ